MNRTVEHASPLLIAGMPASGVSVVARAFSDAGLRFGDNLAPIGHNEVGGQFVDRDVSQWLQKGTGISDAHTWLHARVPEDVEFSPDEERQLLELLQKKSREQNAWGLRDPGLVLRLRAWSRLFPNARWVFVLRDPATVAWSILRRVKIKTSNWTPLQRAHGAFKRWRLYGDRIHEFAQQHPDRVLMLWVPDDCRSPIDAQINHVVRDKWAYNLDEISLSTSYRARLMSGSAPPWLAGLGAFDLITAGRAKQLKRLQQSVWEHHLPRKPETATARSLDDPQPEPTRRPVICVARAVPFEYTQTFVLAHIEELPARVKVVNCRNGLSEETGLPLLTMAERAGRALALEFAWRSAFGTRALRRYLKREQVEAVLAEFGTVAVTVADACCAEDVPLIVHFHGYDAYAAATLETHREEYADLFRTAAAFIAVSSEMREQLIRLGAPAEKVHVNSCGVDISQFRATNPAENPARCVAIGRFVDKKAPYLTLLAFHRLLESCPEATLTMFGDGPIMETFVRLAEHLDVSDKVTICGRAAHPEIITALRGARLFVQHSITALDGNSEGTPVSVLEAGACAVPVVATRHAGIKEAVLDGESGFLVDERDVGSMANHMAKLIKDPQLAQQMGKRGREHVSENYSMERSISRLWDVIRGTFTK